MDQLWNTLHDLFDTDDGSLPDIYVLNLSPAGVKNMWTHLSQMARSLAGGGSFWHIADKQDVAVESVPNAAELVVTGEAESFHVVLCGITVEGTVIPDLGVFVFPASIYIDYRMGQEWGPSQLVAFFNLLAQLQAIDEQAVITLPEECTEETRKRFIEAFADYRKSAAPQLVETVDDAQP
jgi:hypothetical protein